MLKIIKSAMDGQDANLGRLNTYEAEHLINDDKYVNQMFVIFNGSYEFR
jgi:N-acetylglutamate synthase/N-acetylornithine aminotransferase